MTGCHGRISRKSPNSQTSLGYLGRGGLTSLHMQREAMNLGHHLLAECSGAVACDVIYVVIPDPYQKTWIKNQNPYIWLWHKSPNQVINLLTWFHVAEVEEHAWTRFGDIHLIHPARCCENKVPRMNHQISVKTRLYILILLLEPIQHK